MVKVSISYTGLPTIEFYSEDIVDIKEIEIENSKNIIISLKDSRQIFLPISKEEFDELLKQGTDLNLEFTL